MALSLSSIFPWLNNKSESQYPILKRGDSGHYVEVLQQQLQRNGFYTGSIDGQFGAKTESAVIHYQQTHLNKNKQTLTVDGIVGEGTWWAIFNPTTVEKNNKKNTNSNTLIPNNISNQRFKVLEVAVNEYKKGVKEIPDGSNWGPDVKKYLQFCGLGPNFWCAAFVNWVVHTALGDVPWKSKIAHVATLYNKCKTLNFSHSISSGYKPRPGDLYIIVHGDNTGHIGIILRVSNDGKSLNVIEGNSSNKVALRTRIVGKDSHIGYINYFGDESTPYTFETGLVNNTDNSNLSSTR